MPPARPVAKLPVAELGPEPEAEEEEADGPLVVDWKRICRRGRFVRRWERMGCDEKAVRPNWRDASLEDIVRA